MSTMTYSQTRMWRTGLRRIGPSLEDGVVTAALTLMMLVPVIEILLRAFFRTGIYGASALEQHLGFMVAMFGAVIAAREKRLLAIPLLPMLLRGNVKRTGAAIAGLAGFTICLLLVWTSSQFLVTEYDPHRMLTHYVPVWMVQAVMPIGFLLIAWRLLMHSARTTILRMIMLVLGTLACAYIITQPNPETWEFLITICLLVISAVLGMPLFTVLGGLALILFWAEDIPLASIAVDQFRMVINPTLPAVPLFTLAGYFLAESKAPTRLLRLFQALFGNSRSGAAGVAVAGSCLLTSFTGASGVTILALGGLLLPMLTRWNYSQRAAIGVATGAGLPGVLLAPSLPLILYAIVANVSVQEMFLGALPPALLMIALVFVWSRWQGDPQHRKTKSFDRQEAWAALLEAKWELALPVVAIVSLFSGLATPVEAAAITALYAFVVEVFIHRDLHPIRDIPRVMTECGLLVGGILLILGVALGLTNYFVDAQVPERLSNWMQQTIHAKWVFLLVLNVFLLLAGCLMDIFSAIIVLTPLIIPIALAFGIDPVHLGVLFLANLELGYLTPPVGINLFYAASRFKRPLLEVCRSVLTLVPVLALGVLIITYFPELTRLLIP